MKYKITKFTIEEKQDILEQYGEWIKPENMVWVEKEYKEEEVMEDKEEKQEKRRKRKRGKGIKGGKEGKNKENLHFFTWLSWVISVFRNTHLLFIKFIICIM